MKPVTISALELAINAARFAAPAQGREAALSDDVNVLAGIYGELIFRGHRGFDADSVSVAARQALERWLPVDLGVDAAGEASARQSARSGNKSQAA